MGFPPTPAPDFPNPSIAFICVADHDSGHKERSDCRVCRLRTCSAFLSGELVSKPTSHIFGSASRRAPKRDTEGQRILPVQASPEASSDPKWFLSRFRVQLTRSRFVLFEIGPGQKVGADHLQAIAPSFIAAQH